MLCCEALRWLGVWIPSPRCIFLVMDELHNDNVKKAAIAPLKHQRGKTALQG